jgi:uroporphyrinogen-III synthase
LARKIRVLVTRPAGQADPLCKLLEAAGASVERLPAIEILEPDDTDRLDALVERLDKFQLAIFVSANAVHHGLPVILTRRAWPTGLAIATVGPTSGQAVAQYGLTLTYVPVHEYSSEGLLALEALQDMRGRRVIIFRGNGGRSKLYDTLTARGASVEYAEVYRRRCPETDPQAMLDLLQPGRLDVITVASNETLENLVTMAGPAGLPLLLEKRLIVPGQRQVAFARELGFRQAPIVAENAGDEAFVAALERM